jgi:hypothetical protein
MKTASSCTAGTGILDEPDFINTTRATIQLTSKTCLKFNVDEIETYSYRIISLVPTKYSDRKCGNTSNKRKLYKADTDRKERNSRKFI